MNNCRVIPRRSAEHERVGSVIRRHFHCCEPHVCHTHSKNQQSQKTQTRVNVQSRTFTNSHASRQPCLVLAHGYLLPGITSETESNLFRSGYLNCPPLPTFAHHCVMGLCTESLTCTSMPRLRRTTLPTERLTSTFCRDNVPMYSSPRTIRSS